MRPGRSTEARGGAGLLVLDVGTHKALALAARQEADGELEVCGWAERPFTALEDGLLVDLRAASAVLADVLAAAARQAGLGTRRVVASIDAGQVRCVRSRGSVRTKLPVVLRAAHLQRALDAAADIGLPDDHEILHVLPVGYQVDGARAVRRPLGMRAGRLTTEAAVVTVSSLALDNLQRALEEIDYELVGAAAAPLAAARAALSNEDRTSGAVLLDIGAETLGAVVYRDGVLQGLARVGAGGAHVSRDLAYALHLDLEPAEALKRRAGVALAEAAVDDRQLEVQRGRERLLVSQQMLAGIIEARMEEIFAMARQTLQAQQALALRDRVVVVGGGARLAGCIELAEQVFEAPARLGVPLGLWGWREAAGDPACCTALGLVAYAGRCRLASPAPDSTPWRRAVHTLRRAFDEGAARLGSVPPTRTVTGGATRKPTNERL